MIKSPLDVVHKNKDTNGTAMDTNDEKNNGKNNEKDKPKLRWLLNEDSALTHPRCDWIFKYTDKRPASAKDIPSPDDEKVLQVYWPRRFNYLINDQDEGCTRGDFLKWIKTLTWLTERETLFCLDLARFEPDLVGFVESYERRLLALKFLVPAWLYDDVFEDLVRSGQPLRVQLAREYARNLRLIMRGGSREVLRRKFEELFPAEVQRCREIEEVCIEIIEECKRLMTPGVLQRFYDICDMTFAKLQEDAAIWNKKIPKREFLTRTEYCGIKRYTSTYGACMYICLEESDLPYYAVDDPIINLTSLLCQIDNDRMSLKELNYHNPFNTVQKYMSKGMSLRDATIKTTDIRNDVIVALEVFTGCMTPEHQKSLDKNFWRVCAFENYAGNAFRYGWTDGAPKVDLYWTKEKGKELGQWHDD